MTPIKAVSQESGLQQVLDQLSEIKGQVRDLRTVLMGAGDGETPYGRLPMVEADIKDLKQRVGLLEDARDRAQVISHSAVAVLGVVGGWFVNHLVGFVIK